MDDEPTTFESITAGVTLQPRCEFISRHGYPPAALPPATHVGVILHHHYPIHVTIRPIVLLCTQCAVRMRTHANSTRECATCHVRIALKDELSIAGTIAEYHP